MKISCKFSEAGWCSLPQRPLTLNISLCTAAAGEYFKNNNGCSFLFDVIKDNKRYYITSIYWCCTLLYLHCHLEIPNAPTSSGGYSARVNFVFHSRIPSHLASLLHVKTHSIYKAKLALSFRLFHIRLCVRIPFLVCLRID